MSTLVQWKKEVNLSVSIPANNPNGVTQKMKHPKHQIYGVSVILSNVKKLQLDPIVQILQCTHICSTSSLNDMNEGAKEGDEGNVKCGVNKEKA